MREEAWKRVGSLYPKVKITKEIVKKQPDLGKYEGEELTVIAWLWARTVASPSPAFDGLHVPLISNYFLSTKSRRSVWLEPVVSGRTYHFRIRTGEPDDATKIATGTKDGSRAKMCIRDRREFDPSLPSYSPRLVQQALYTFYSKSNRRAQGSDCAVDKPGCEGGVPGLCPFCSNSEAS